MNSRQLPVPAARRRRRRLAATGALIGAVALSAVACGPDADAGVDKARAANTASADAADKDTKADGKDNDKGSGTGSGAGSGKDGSAGKAVAETGGPKTSWSAAAAVAEKSVSGGQVTDVQLETDDGAQVWKIDVMTSAPRVHNITVDATTGALLGSHADRMPERARTYLKIPLAKLAAAGVGRQDAAGTALTEAGGGFVSAVSIQGSESRPVWRVKVMDGDTRHRVEVDAKSRAVVASEQESGSNARRSSDRDHSGRESDRASGHESGRESGRSAASYEEVRERSDDFGRDHHDWTQHLPR
ncbi:PepSY domain-containing protein [Streptomyces sp. NPDC059009]|uniref:PepSY domain-containing protein n=1 Tax=Streptomyces sp. NPDC059009 TaxID=3346694 RepID=UPI0036B5A2CF